jgi:hypothetical protein
VEEPKEKRFHGRPGPRMGDNIKLKHQKLASLVAGTGFMWLAIGTRGGILRTRELISGGSIIHGELFDYLRDC